MRSDSPDAAAMLREVQLRGRPELRLLLHCGRIEPSPAASRELSSLVARGIDWRALARAAEHHALTPLLSRLLHRELPALCPSELLADVQTAARAHVARSFAAASELLGVLAALKDRGIPALAIKGPVSAALCYGDFGARTFLDLDVLIDEAQVADAARVLCARGYAPHVPLAGRLLQRLVRSGSELLFCHADGRRLLDLHWALLPRGYSFSPGTGGVFAERQTVRVGTADLPTLGSTPTLLFMLLHGMKHDWASLGWLCDVAELVRRRPVDWDAVLGWSAVPGRRRLIDVGLLLAHGLLDAPLPEAALLRARRDRRAAVIALRLARSLVGLDELAAPRSLLSSSLGSAYIHAMELPRDRLRFVHDVVMRPTALEWNALPLPDALSPLHYLVRPLRLAWKHAPRPWSRRRRSEFPRAVR